MSKLTKDDWGNIRDAVTDNLDDIIESYFIDPKEIGNPNKVWVSRDEYKRMLIARVFDDERLKDL